jgi:DNA polymerase III subunit delta
MQALYAAIKEKQFSPAYLLHGEDEFRKEDALRHLIDAAVDPATRDFNFDQRRGADLDGEALASLLAMPPMMADRRVVVIRDITALRKDARGALETYLKSPSADVLVVMTAPADAKEDKTLARLADTVNCEPLTGAKLPKWIASRAEKHLGIPITPAAIELLQDSVGSDLSQLAIELDKLAAFAHGGEIDEAAVAAVVGVRRDETMGRLLDAVAQRNSTDALALIPGVLQHPKNSAVTTVMALTTQTLALAIGKARGLRQWKDYFDLLRSGSFNFTGRAWGEAATAWVKAVGSWSLADLDHALEVLLQADLALKGSKVSSEEQILASAVLAICGGSAARSAA